MRWKIYALLFIFFLTNGQVWAVVPSSVSLETAAEEKTTQQRLMDIIEKLEIQERQNIDFLKEIKTELMRLKQKEKTGVLESQ